MQNKKILAGALLASVFVNAFLGGFIVSRCLMGGHPMPPFMGGHGAFNDKKHPAPHGKHHGMRLDFGFAKAAAALDSPHREAVEAMIAAQDNGREDTMRAMAARFDALHAMTVAEHFDAEAFKAAVADMASYDSAMRESMTAFILSIAQALPDDQRIEFFTILDKHRPKPPFRDGDVPLPEHP